VLRRHAGHVLKKYTGAARYTGLVEVRTAGRSAGSSRG
jgi:hypothetical protein